MVEPGNPSNPDGHVAYVSAVTDANNFVTMEMNTHGYTQANGDEDMTVYTVYDDTERNTTGTYSGDYYLGGRNPPPHRRWHGVHLRRLSHQPAAVRWRARAHRPVVRGHESAEDRVAGRRRRRAATSPLDTDNRHLLVFEGLRRRRPRRPVPTELNALPDDNGSVGDVHGQQRPAC